MLTRKKPCENLNFMGFFLFLLCLFVVSPSWASVDCLFNKTKSYAIRGSKENRERQLVEKGRLLPFLGENRAGSIYRTELDGKIFFVSSKYFVKIQKDSCSSVDELAAKPLPDSLNASPLESGSETQNQPAVGPTETQNWFWGIEAGYALGLSTKPFNNIITPTPDPTVDVNDDAFDSPFIDNVENGTGMAVRGFLEYRWNHWLRTKFLLGYSQREFEYTFRQNPHNTDQSFVTYDQLSRSTATFSYQAIHLGAIPKLHWDLGSVAIDFGLGVFVNYYFEVKEIEFRTAPLKLTPYFVETGYEKFNVELAPRIELHIDFVYLYGQFNNQMSTSDFSMSPEIGLGLTF